MHLQGRRLIVRRARLVCPQASMWPDWRHFAFLIDLEGRAVDLDAFHGHHAVVESAIDDLKKGAGMEHSHSGNVSADAGVTVLRRPGAQPDPLDGVAR